MLGTWCNNLFRGGPPSPGISMYPNFADPGSSGIWADLSTEERAQRDLVSDQMVLGWYPDPDEVTFDDTITITSAAQLNSWANGTAVSGVTRNPARNQKVLLDPAGTWTYANSATISNFRQQDWVANGKILFIDGQGTDSRQIWTIYGCRGILIRNVRFGASLLDTGADLTWSPGFITNNITAAGAGFQVGQTLTVVTRGGNVYADPVLQVASIDGSGGITGLTVVSRGVITASSVITVSSATSTVNASITGSFPVNPRETAVFTVTRNSTFPGATIVNLDQCELGSGFTTSNYSAFMTAFRADNVEQFCLTRCSLKGYQANAVISARRIVMHDNDFQMKIADDMICTNFRGNTAMGSGQTFLQLWPDGQVFGWQSYNTYRNPIDDCAYVNSAGHDMGFDQMHSDSSQWGTQSDTGGYQIWVEFEAAYSMRLTYKDRPIKSTRYNGACQGLYLDDTPFAIQSGAFSCIYSEVAQNAQTAWNGNVWYGRCTAVRTGAQPPSGGGTTFNAPSGFVTRKLTGTSITSDHTLRKCVGNFINTGGSGYSPSNQIQISCTTVNANTAGAYAAAFPGTFSTDSESRMIYSFTDTVSRGDFRTNLWNQFGRANDGFINPSLW